MEFDAGSSANETAVAIFAGGCFWCTEAVFLELKGVLQVTSGYIGGSIENPTYEAVCSGYSGHAEAIRLHYDPQRIGYEALLEVFFATHDPTTLNRQGADVGTQYRSEIFTTSETQKNAALQYIHFLEKENVFEKKIVTKVTETSTFYEAEPYHQKYFNRNPEQSYCSFVILPKLEKFRKYYAMQLK